jgi:hypothetical protein
MKNYYIRIAIILVLMFRTTMVFAVWYQVEVIIFENLYPNTDNEKWYKTPELVPLKNTVNLIPYQQQLNILEEKNKDVPNISNSQIPYGMLSEDNNRLEGIYRVLRLSREYRPLYHVSWQQPGLSDKQAKPIHIQSENFENLFELTIPTLMVSDSMPIELYEPTKLIVDGTLQIRSSLYLHIDLDFVLFRKPTVDNAEVHEQLETGLIANRINNPADYVRLTESRRIKLNELHYYDHPLFGVIVQVSRYEPD